MATRSELDRKFVAAVERLGRALRAARQDIATDLGMSLLQLQVIEHLCELGPRRIGVLADELDLAQPTVSDALATLERKFLLHRHPDPADRRASLVGLSAEGLAVAERIHGRLAPIVDQDRAVDEADQATALMVLLSEIRHLQEAGVITVDRSCLSCHHFEPARADVAARCLLLGTDLARSDLRVDCAEHQPSTDGPS